MAKRDGPIALAIFVVALAARLLFLLTSPDRAWPHSVYYEGDALLWVQWAAAIDGNQAFEFNLPIHPPAVAYTIAWLYAGVHASGLLGMKVLWCVMSAATCALLYLACAAAMARRVAVIAASLLAFSFNQYLLATSLNSETPYVLIVVALVPLTERLARRPTRWHVALAGGLHGTAMLLRPEHPLLLAMWLGWVVLSAKCRGVEVSRCREDAAFSTPSHPDTSAPLHGLRPRLAGAALTTAIALLVVLPWTVHAVLSVQRFNGMEIEPVRFNLAPLQWTAAAQDKLLALPAFARFENFNAINQWAQRQGHARVDASEVERYFGDNYGWTPRPLSPAVLVSNQGPMSFALANHPKSDGGFSRAAFEDPALGANPNFALGFPPHNRVFTDGWRVGWEYISGDFHGWLGLVGRKLQHFADGISGGLAAGNLPLGRYGVREPVDIFVADSSAARPWQVLTLAFIAAGLPLALARHLRLMPWLLVIAYKIVVTILFYGYARQAASIAPAFAVLAAITIDSMLWPVDRAWPGWLRWRWAVAGTIALAMLAADVALSRRGETATIAGQIVPRPDLDGAFASFGRIEIRPPPP